MKYDWSYLNPRARASDPSTSHEAAKFALSGKADSERRAIYQALASSGPMTPREIATATGIDYIEVQRPMSEVDDIAPTNMRRGRCRVWRVTF